MSENTVPEVTNEPVTEVKSEQDFSPETTEETTEDTSATE